MRHASAAARSEKRIAAIRDSAVERPSSHPRGAWSLECHGTVSPASSAADLDLVETGAV